MQNNEHPLIKFSQVSVSCETLAALKHPISIKAVFLSTKRSET